MIDIMTVVLLALLILNAWALFRVLVSLPSFMRATLRARNRSGR